MHSSAFAGSHKQLSACAAYIPSWQGNCHKLPEESCAERRAELSCLQAGHSRQVVCVQRSKFCIAVDKVNTHKLARRTPTHSITPTNRRQEKESSGMGRTTAGTPRRVCIGPCEQQYTACTGRVTSSCSTVHVSMFVHTLLSLLRTPCPFVLAALWACRQCQEPLLVQTSQHTVGVQRLKRPCLMQRALFTTVFQHTTPLRGRNRQQTNNHRDQPYHLMPNHHTPNNTGQPRLAQAASAQSSWYSSATQYRPTQTHATAQTLLSLHHWNMPSSARQRLSTSRQQMRPTAQTPCRRKAQQVEDRFADCKAIAAALGPALLPVGGMQWAACAISAGCQHR